MLLSGTLEEPAGPKQRKQAIQLFQEVVDGGHFDGVVSNRQQRASRKQSLAFWKKIKEENPHFTTKDIKALQEFLKSLKKKEKRKRARAMGVSTQGRLLDTSRWRTLRLGDCTEEIFREKLAFVPVLHVKSFSQENLAKLQGLQEELIETMRLRGGRATKTRKHQKGRSFGLTVAPGGRRPTVDAEQDEHYSGTIQLKKFPRNEESLRTKVIDVITACIEDAFGDSHWYRVAKEVYAKVPNDRRLPNSSMPASNIWWNWNVQLSVPHIDWNAMSPCFVFTPHTYKGAELLCGANNTKIPMKAGQVVGGSWQRFPHCNDTLHSDFRYSFVVYFDYRCLCKSYWTK